MKPKNVVLLVTTGSIGVSTQKVAADLPDHIRIVGMASRESVDGMETAIAQFKPKAVAMTNREKARELEKRLGAPGGPPLPNGRILFSASRHKLGVRLGKPARPNPGL